ncbi:nucleolar DEAD-box protein required for synthesis of 60S ribosomal subunit [Agyrium rufum]|nr:nucleolar DEAD-box protein required for synthesis of 60S ribosomal subunit [Agyrium rufum]
MAPSKVDDLILTISDDDDSIPLEEEDVGSEEDNVHPSAKPASQNSKKRKRNDAPAKEQASNKLKKNGKVSSKKNKATNEKTAPAQSNEEEAPSQSEQGEDDGAMDSDFEFQLGDGDTGVLEDFDGWESRKVGDALGASGSRQGGNGSKKGVDIDELIARRRERQDGKGVGKKAEIGSDVEEGSSEANISVEELSASEEEDGGAFDGVDGDDGEEDELLAADAFGMGVTGSDEEEEEDGKVVEDDMAEGDSDDDTPPSDDESIASPVPHPDDLASDISSPEDEEDPAEIARRKAFFAPEEDEPLQRKNATSTADASFQSMSLSRPILRGLASISFTSPTPIQVKTIPIALLGKDVVGGAVTGSGKTAAFMIPILERLLYRPKKIPTSRVAILMPTRELAVQCFNVSKKLASFTDITFCQLVGGFSLREQESVLRTRPDVIIATPGRFIDHMRNSASFTVDTLEILVLDEADRMLEDGFADELNEILTTIPKSRQTMLFSATMTEDVDKLIRVGLNRPARLLVDAKRQTVGTLTQEFVRLRPGREDKRMAYLMQLCSTVHTDRVIIFFRQKKEAHRARIIFGLCGFKASELHGNMTQEQRISAIESFRSLQTTHLLATDVASRGLDIKSVSVVLNYEAPQSHSIYLHRVGRTARAGRAGRACTIASESDRKVVKEAVKSAKAQGAKIVSRIVEPADADKWVENLKELEEEVEDVLREEKEEKMLGSAEMQVRKGENLVDHEKEIMSRPKRTWFESESDKRMAKKVGRRELNGEDVDGVGGGKARMKAGKLSGKDKKKMDDRRDRAEGKIWKKGKGDVDAGGKGAGGKGAGGKGAGGKGAGGRGAGKPGAKRVGDKGGRRPRKGMKGKPK